MQTELFQVHDSDSRVWEISQLNSSIRKILEGNFRQIWVRGEISNLKAHSSGHYYFQLKDKSSQLKGVLFRGDAQNLISPLEDGASYLAFGDLTVFEPRGDYQIRVRHFMREGLGHLQQEFDRLKKKLSVEGLFDENNKNPLPLLPLRIGLITSPEGAAKEDFISILKRRKWKGVISFYPSLVQGPKAAGELIQSLKNISKSKEKLDLVVLTRGGGSIEDLWSFNDENLVRLISDFPVPLISAVGHQTDFVLTDFVADIRAETPSGAAELISSLYLRETEQMENLRSSMKQATHNRLEKLSENLGLLKLGIQLISPKSRLENAYQTLDELSERLTLSTHNLFLGKKKELELISKMVEGANIQTIMKKGFCYVRDQNKKLLSDAAKIKSDQTVDVIFRDGERKMTAQ